MTASHAFTLIIRLARVDDTPFLAAFDPHIPDATRQRKIAAGEVLIAEADGATVGLLRWGWFWDHVPFMNQLYVFEAWRGQGIATRLIAQWEAEPQVASAEFILTSTYASETAQHLYRKCGYQDIGGFVLPYSGEPMELILFKALASSATTTAQSSSASSS